MQLNVGMWYAAFDYVRLTTKAGSDDEATKDLYRKVGSACLGQQEGEAPAWEDWVWQGYYGARCDAVSYGAGRQGCILQISGPLAHAAREYNPPFDNAARVDVQVSVWFKRDIPHLAKWAADESAEKRKTANGQRWKINVRDGYDDGDTCYLGTRGSPVFIRIYDKWRQSSSSEEWRHCWRFEVELSGEPAKEVWTGAHSSAPGPEACAGWVRWYLARWGVSLPDTVPGILASRPSPTQRRTDNDKRLAWLRNQVRPSIDKLLASGVSLEHVREALGLPMHEDVRTIAKLRSKREQE